MIRMIMIVIVIIVTASPLPPTHLEYPFADSLVFGVRALDLRELEKITMVSEVWGLWSSRLGASGDRRTEAGSLGRLEVTNV